MESILWTHLVLQRYFNLSQAGYLELLLPMLSAFSDEQQKNGIFCLQPPIILRTLVSCDDFTIARLRHSESIVLIKGNLPL